MCKEAASYLRQLSLQPTKSLLLCRFPLPNLNPHLELNESDLRLPRSLLQPSNPSPLAHHAHNPLQLCPAPDELNPPTFLLLQHVELWHGLLGEEGGYLHDTCLFLLDRLLRLGFVLFEHVRASGFFNHPEDLLQVHVQNLCAWGLVIGSRRREKGPW